MYDFICKMFTNNDMQTDQSAIYAATTQMPQMRVVRNNRRRREDSSRLGDTSEDKEKSGTHVQKL